MLALFELARLGLSTRMRIIIRVLVFTFLGLLVGIGSALWMAGLLPGGPRLGGTVEVEGWVSDWSIGSEAANPYVRARVARYGLLALRKEEAVYFTRTHDDDGELLNEDCVYKVSGGGMPAEWWSITLYDSDSRLPMNTDEALSFDLTQAEASLAQSNLWQFQVSAQTPQNPLISWVSSREAGTFDLMLRLYRPSEALLDGPESTLQPPSIERISCGEGR